MVAFDSKSVDTKPRFLEGAKQKLHKVDSCIQDGCTNPGIGMELNMNVILGARHSDATDWWRRDGGRHLCCLYGITTFADFTNADRQLRTDFCGRQMRTTLADDRCGRQTRTDICGRQMRTDFCGPNS